MRIDELYHYANVDEYGEDYYDPLYNSIDEGCEAYGVPRYEL